jgi:hypothetical protein
MRRYSLPWLAGALWLAASAAALAQLAPPAGESAQQNVRESEQYQQLVCNNAAFRARRMQEECGPISDPQLHQSCLASFECNRGPASQGWRQAPPSERIR